MQRSCADVNSSYKRKCWTNSGGPLVNSLLWDPDPDSSKCLDPNLVNTDPTHWGKVITDEFEILLLLTVGLRGWEWAEGAAEGGPEAGVAGLAAPRDARGLQDTAPQHLASLHKREKLSTQRMPLPVTVTCWKQCWGSATYWCRPGSGSVCKR